MHFRKRRRQESPISGESTKQTVKTIRVRECRVFPGATVVTNARVYYTPRAAAGASSTRHSPRPLFRAESPCTTRTHRAAGKRMCVSNHCARDDGSGCLKIESGREQETLLQEAVVSQLGQCSRRETVTPSRRTRSRA